MPNNKTNQESQPPDFNNESHSHTQMERPYAWERSVFAYSVFIAGPIGGLISRLVFDDWGYGVVFGAIVGFTIGTLLFVANRFDRFKQFRRTNAISGVVEDVAEKLLGVSILIMLFFIIDLIITKLIHR